MSHDSAKRKAIALRRVMLANGVPEVQIHLLPGRPVAGDTWDSGFFVADMSHHTVSRYNPSNLTPVLGLCMNGRPSDGLGGPLCNGYGGWDLCYRIITFGYANHPGAGGPITVPALTAGRFTIPRDSARRYAWGTEFEGGLSLADWDRKLTNPRTKDSMTFREFMGRSNAALEEYLQIANHAHMEHSTWTNRKIDRLGYSASKGIDEKNRYRVVELPAVDVSNIAEQFRRAGDLLAGEVTPTYGVRVIQRALNRRGAKLVVNGLVDARTLARWKMFENKLPKNKRSGRPMIPDGKSVSALLGTTHEVRR